MFRPVPIAVWILSVWVVAIPWAVHAEDEERTTCIRIVREDDSSAWVVEGIDEESPGFIAGIRDGDILVTVGGMELGDDPHEITNKLGAATEVDFVVRRKDREIELTVQREPLADCVGRMRRRTHR